MQNEQPIHDAGEPAEPPEGAGDGEAAMFPFLQEEASDVEELIRAVRLLLRRERLAAQHVRALGALLWGLERLPLSTDGIAVELTLKYETNQEGNWNDLYLDGQALRLGSGYSVYDPAVGGDHHTWNVFEVEIGGYRDSRPFEEIVEWLESFKERAADPDCALSVYDESEGDAIDWDAESNPDRWNKLK